MRDDARAFLWDIRDRAEAINEFGTFADCQSDRMPRSAVERRFEVIGGALNRLA